MLRRGVLLGTLVAVVMLVGGAGPASSSIAPDDYLGEWTADTSMAVQVADETFTVNSTDENTGRTDAGSDSPSFDDYCKSTYPGVLPVTYFTVTTTNHGTFGGCVSTKTGGHLYAWNTDQVWYAHPSLVKGEGVLNGAIQIEHPSTPADTYKFRAHHPEVDFIAHLHKVAILKKGSRHAAKVTTITGIGFVHISTPPPAGCSSIENDSGDGVIHFEEVKIGGPAVVEIDKLTLKPYGLDGSPGAGDYSACVAFGGNLSFPVKVISSDKGETAPCAVGSEGFFSLHDKSGEDEIHLSLGRCHISETVHQENLKGHSKIAVALSFDEKGY